MRSRPLALAGLAVLLGVALVLLAPRPARAFGDQGAFDPRLHPSLVRADDPAIVDAPFLYWSGDGEVAALTSAEVAGLRRFFALGGVLLVDDAAPGPGGEKSAFARSARREIARALPDTIPVGLGVDHVIFRSFYLLRRAEGRVEGPASLDAIVRGGQAQVIFSAHDLGGALARGPSGAWEQPVVPGGDMQRERAIRLAVNIAMYVLCSNYKDDQVHAPFLMRRRALSTP